MTHPRKPAKGTQDRRVRAALVNACREAEALLTIVPPMYGQRQTLATLAVLRDAIRLAEGRRHA